LYVICPAGRCDGRLPSPASPAAGISPEFTEFQHRGAVALQPYGGEGSPLRVKRCGLLRAAAITIAHEFFHAEYTLQWSRVRQHLSSLHRPSQRIAVHS
jgi:hypothetical protein